MSTELVAIERINIKKDNGDADSLRSCLAHYLQQFLDSASIESMTLHELTIKIDGESVLDVSDKTGGVGLSGLDKDWQHTETVHKAIEQIILDADVEVFLSYDMIHYFSNKNFYGSAFWMDTLQEFGCEAVRYHGLEYYDVESNVVMLYFDGKQLCDNPDYVPEEEVKDIDAWFCYTFDMELDAGDTFTVKQVDKMQETIASVRSVFGREEGDEVGHGHEGVEHVGDVPHEVERHEGADGHHADEDDAEGLEGLVAEQVDPAAFGVDAPAEDGGEGEHGEAHGHHDGADAGQRGFKGRGGERSAGKRAFRVPETGAENGETGHGADDDGVDERSEHADVAHGHVIVRRGRGVGHGCGAEAGFIGEDASRHAHLQGQHDGGAGKAARGRGAGEGIVEDHGEHAGHLVDVCGDDDEGTDDVDDGHERHELARHRTYAGHAADDDDGDEHEHDHGGDDRRNAEGGVQSVGDGMGLRHVADAEAADAAEESEERAEPGPFFAEAVLDVVHGAAHDVSGGGDFAVFLSQHGFRVLGGHAHHGGAPHPEEGAGAAGEDGGGHTGNVAHAHGGGQGGHECLERGEFSMNVGILGASLPGETEAFTETGPGKEAQTEGKIEARSENEGHHDRSPDVAVQYLDELGELFHVVKLLAVSGCWSMHNVFLMRNVAPGAPAAENRKAG